MEAPFSKLDVTDPVRVLRFLFRGGVALSCLDAADVDDTGTVNVTDAVCLLSFLFHGGLLQKAHGPRHLPKAFSEAPDG